VNLYDLRLELDELAGRAAPATPAGLGQVHRLARSERLMQGAAFAAVVVALLSISVAVLIARSSGAPDIVTPANPAPPATTTPPGPDPAAGQRFATAEFVPTADQDGNTVGYVKGPGHPTRGTPQRADGAEEVYRNPDGSGGVVGYITDFGFVDKATFESPEFDIDAERAHRRAEIEANARQVDPDFRLDALERATLCAGFDAIGMECPPIAGAS
jgi:hypothetical protein